MIAFGSVVFCMSRRPPKYDDDSDSEDDESDSDEGDGTDEEDEGSDEDEDEEEEDSHETDEDSSDDGDEDDEDEETGGRRKSKSTGLFTRRGREPAKDELLAAWEAEVTHCHTHPG
jgi:hypothetical protein